VQGVSSFHGLEVAAFYAFQLAGGHGEERNLWSPLTKYPGAACSAEGDMVIVTGGAKICTDESW
jgi:hypothetical protein